MPDAMNIFPKVFHLLQSVLVAYLGFQDYYTTARECSTCQTTEITQTLAVLAKILLLTPKY